MIWGAPFLGAFDSRDIIGLIEIAANARADNSYPDAATIRRLERLLESYHAARDKTVFARDEPDEFVRAEWFPYRYTEWLHFTTISHGITFAGRRVLDVGAGTGADSVPPRGGRCRCHGARDNPMLVRRGLDLVPEARWVGGMAHALPFASCSFDIVCCNAALHHMRDTATSLEEMLRVLKPGGWLITTGDPYRASHLGEDHELSVFDRHPGVLLGVNELIPSFTAFESVLARYRDRLDIKLITGALHPAVPTPSPSPRSPFARVAAAAKRLFARGPGLPEVSDSSGDIDDAMRPQWWDFDRDREMLGSSSGSIALCCRVREPIVIAPRCQEETVLSAGVYAQSLTDYQQAIQTLAPHVPAHMINSPFPGERQTKFELLNGWQAPHDDGVRSAYKRARWFLRRPSEAATIGFAVRRPNGPSTMHGSIDALVNGISEH